ncbi:dynamin family protein [Gemmiger formicilis]|uniref:dynamin family protein n=1 Tax=Gemmiger formicilis TaxID=745368 RepID=UPI00241C34F7|nr:dynamin family protein [Gemmiger formicilis]
MREIFIKYNPYRIETTVTVDGKAPKQNSRLNFGDRRLQEWIEDLPKILFDECSSREFELTFQGTTPDFEDVEAMCQDAKKSGMEIKLKHIPAKEIADKETAIADIFDEIQAGPFDELKQPDVVKAFTQARNSDFEVNVVATMSAGKSTLINALLRQKLMPAKQEACTATITEIKDTDTTPFRARVYNSEGHLIQSIPDVTFDIMNSLNSNRDVSKVQLQGDIPFVSADDISLVLVDTPGPNNSRDPAHKAATYRMLSESSKTVVLYILNSTQLAVNDDFNLLRHVADSMRVGGKQSRDRFIFVVNKLDEFKKGEDNIKASIEKVRNYLHDNGIENPNIYPASALTALNIRTILANSDDDDDDDVYEAKGKVRKFNRNQEMHFEEYAPLTPSARGEIEGMLADARKRGDANAEALIHCGIVPIEMAIKMYVQKYAKTAKIKNVVDTFSKRLESAKSFETTKQEIATNQDKQKEILATIAAIKKKMADGENAKKFKSRIESINYDDEIRKLADGIILESQKKITAQLSSGKGKMSRGEAEELCKQYARFADNLQAEVQVKLEDLVTNHIHKNAEKLLDEYRAKISALAEDINVGSVTVSPFEIMEGAIDGLDNIEDILEDSAKTEKKKEVVGNHKDYKEWLGVRRWFNSHLGTNFHVDYEVVDDYDWVEHSYIDGTLLSQQFFAPIQEKLYENSNNSVVYAKEQAKNIKKAFAEKFDELDMVLKQKLKDLEDCANNEKNVDAQIQKSQAKLQWLENIQAKINAVLDI